MLDVERTHTTDYYWALKRKEVLTKATTWTDLKNTRAT